MTEVEVIFTIMFAFVVFLFSFALHQASEARRERFKQERVRTQRHKINSLYGRDSTD
jgi:hypothetical protein